MENLLRRLDLTSLRLFVAVCQEQNIARAAEREFIAPSAVSRRIAEIEATIGLPVIERHQRGIRVTAVGEAVYRHAQAAFGSLEALGAELSRFHSGAKGSVRLAANISSILQFLPEDIAAFQRVFPEVRIELEEQHSVEVFRLLEERAADVGICLASSVGGNLATIPYRTDRLALIVPKGHRLAEAAQVSFADTLGDEHVIIKGDSALTRLVTGEAARLGGELNIKFRVTSLDAVCRLVHVGLGIAVIPRLVGELYLHTLNLAVRPLHEQWAKRDLVLAFKARDQLSASAEALVHFLSQKK